MFVGKFLNMLGSRAAYRSLGELTMSEVKGSTAKTSSAGKVRLVPEVTLRTSDDRLWCDLNMAGVSFDDNRRPLDVTNCVRLRDHHLRTVGEM